MDPAEFLKKIQARQDAALASRQLNKPTLTIQRIQPQRGGEAKIVISCDRAGYLNASDAKRIWTETTQGQGGVVTMSDAMNLEVRIGGNMRMYQWLETFLTRLMSIVAYNGVEEFRLSGQWEKVQVKTGTFNRSEVQMSYFGTLE